MVIVATLAEQHVTLNSTGLLKKINIQAALVDNAVKFTQAFKVNPLGLDNLRLWD